MLSSLSRVLNRHPSDSFVVAATRKPDWDSSRSRIQLQDGLYPDFGVNVVNGVAWFWLLGRWQDLPNVLWAWKYIVWTAGHYYDGHKLWVPSLLLFDFWEYDRSSYAVSAPVIDRQPVPSATATIAPHLSQILRRSGNSKLCRTCRLVCRDWANALPLRDPERCDLRFEEGVVWYRIEEEWRHLPCEYWAWTLREKEWWVERRQGRWQLKLVHPVNDSIRQNPTYPSVPSSPLPLSGTSGRSGCFRAAALPQELFKYICDAADSESWSWRLVCRYWNRRCTPHVFKKISAGSPERIRILWTHRRHDLIMRHLMVIDYVPTYNKQSKFPWLHLLTQLCASTQSVWTDEDEETGSMTIQGRFAGGHRTIRSVHFALPRSLPRSLSRGIKSLYLVDVDFSRFEDLAHLVCELPGLEELFCQCEDFNSLPIELPRQPRTNRNKLRKVQIATNVPELEPTLPTLRLLLSVYALPSFFSEGEIAVLVALLQLSVLPVLMDENPLVRYEDNPCNHSHMLSYLHDTTPISDLTILGLHVLRDPAQNRIILNIVADCRYTTADKNVEHWARFDAEFSKIGDLIHRAECIFGFQDRKTMVCFATTILATKMPSISRLAVVRYAISVDSEEGFRERWFRAALYSEELTGTGTEDLAEVYS